jgi:putative endopeptidase
MIRAVSSTPREICASGGPPPMARRSRSAPRASRTRYGGYTAVDDVKLNGRLTLGENVADNGGLRLAWMALMDDLKAKALGEVDGFSPEQRFFVGWAQMWCENRTKEIALLHAKTNPHSPGRYRTNGVVSNFPEFQRAFSCQPTSKMVNQPICRVW